MSKALRTTIIHLNELGEKHIVREHFSHSSMTLSVPECSEMTRARMTSRRKMSLGSAPLLSSGKRSPPPTRRTSIADAFSESIRTLAITARRNSSPLSRKSTKKMKKSRLVGKNGICNVYNTNVPKKDRQYLSWTTFASIYYTIAFWHGDLSPELDYLNQTHCVVNLDSLYSSFLFAVETHHTIGYGHSLGLISLFEKAVICLRDGQLCFLCRVGDMRNTHLVEAHVRLQFISDRETAEGEIEPLHQFEMKVGPSITDDDRLFLVWPTTLCHVIDKDSPLYEYTSNSLLSAQFEIICLLEGIVESTGMTAQAKTSYLPCEILWGHRFRKLVTYQRSNGSYQIDYNLFNSTYAVKTPHCSALEHYAQDSCPKDYFCHDSHEHKLEDNRSWESSPAPSPSPFSYPASPLPPHHVYTNCNNNNRTSEEMLLLTPPTIVVQCPSACSSPNHLRRIAEKKPSPPMNSLVTDSCRTSSCDMSTRPSSALSDLEEECLDPGSPTKQPDSRSTIEVAT
uniref:Inward rectifier potassium channel n=1 Tax=Heterorhabditis bacteriophora TaxID=37862 RepID=A0A1I7XC65_HETBA